MRVQISLWGPAFNSLESGNARSYGNYVFKILWKCHTVFHSLPIFFYLIVRYEIYFYKLRTINYDSTLWNSLRLSHGSLHGLDLDFLPSVPAWCEWHTGTLRRCSHDQNLKIHYRERKEVFLGSELPPLPWNPLSPFSKERSLSENSSIRFLIAGLIGFSIQNFFWGYLEIMKSQ